MSRTLRSFSTACAAALALALIGLSSITARAASINYGNFGPVPPGVSFLGVTETSFTDPVPLYGPPTPYAVGLDFDPMGFGSVSTGGVADITDGQLNFTAMGNVAGNQAVGIGAITVRESGDYTIGGVGTPATKVFAGAIIRATVIEINGAPVAPISLAPSNASFSASLPGQVIAAPWGLGPITVDVGALMAGLGFGPLQRPTKVEVVINNSLATFSEPGTLAFIAKKDFRIDIVPNPGPFPEPGTMTLAGLALCGLGAVRRRKS